MGQSAAGCVHLQSSLLNKGFRNARGKVQLVFCLEIMVYSIHRIYISSVYIFQIKFAT